MSGRRFVVLGLARVRAPWFAATSAWANSAAVPVEFIKCVSAAELRARLGGGRAVSAVLVDAAAPGVDRDLVDLARAAGAAVVVVDESRLARDWVSMGASAVLDPHFDRGALLDCLTGHAGTIASATPGNAAAAADTADPDVAERASSWRAPLVAVTGTPGAGASTVAIAVAQALAGRPANRGAVLLADLCLRGDQTIYHDPGDVVPGVSELVDAHRRGSPEPSQVRAMCWPIEERGYDLLLGLRRPWDWTALRSRAVAAAIESLRTAYRAVVADVDPDVEGESQTGSVDIEERHVMARLAFAAADVTVLVTAPTLTGLHGTIRLQDDLVDLGVDPDSMLTVVNRARRTPRHRAELSAVLHQLGSVSSSSSPLFLPDRRQVEAIHRAGGRLPMWLESPLDTLVGRALDHRPVHEQAVGATLCPVDAGDHRRVS